VNKTAIQLLHEFSLFLLFRFVFTSMPHVVNELELLHLPLVSFTTAKGVIIEESVEENEDKGSE